jgi:uncharacterized protein YqgV (UPF0045/DUF77 family)
MQPEHADAIHSLGILAEDEGDLENALILVTKAERIYSTLGTPKVKTATKNRERIEQTIQEKKAGSQ